MEVISKNPIIIDGETSNFFGKKWKEKRAEKKASKGEDDRSLLDKLRDGVQRAEGGLDKSKDLVSTLGGILGTESSDNDIDRGADVNTKPIEKKGLSNGAKIGIGVGGLVVVGLIIFAIVKSKKGKK